MNKRINFLLFIILILSFYTKVNACEVKEFNRLNSLAKKVEFNYKYEIIKIDNNPNYKKWAKFSVTAYNLNNDFIVLCKPLKYNGPYNRSFHYNKSGTQTSNDFYSGIYQIKIVARTGSCRGVTLIEKSLKLPYYNNFYESDICKDYADFKYCKDEFTENEINGLIFDKEASIYINQLEEETMNNHRIKENKKILHYIIIAIFLFAIIIVVIKVIANYKRRSVL